MSKVSGKHGIRDEIGRRIFTLRIRRGMSLETLSTKSGIPVEELNRIERGDRIPSLDVLHRIAINLGDDVSGLIGSDL